MQFVLTCRYHMCAHCCLIAPQHKGDIVCDICKQPINNLPPIPEEILAAREAARRRRQPQFNTSGEPTAADYIFDGIRATWITLIVCVLFFDISMGQAFAAGAVAGLGFMLLTYTLARCVRRARVRRETADAARLVAASMAAATIASTQQQYPIHATSNDSPSPGSVTVTIHSSPIIRGSPAGSGGGGGTGSHGQYSTLRQPLLGEEA